MRAKTGVHAPMGRSCKNGAAETRVRELHTPDMLSRALYEYDGSKLPDQNGYAGPFEYRDCPVFNVLNGIWDPDVLIASVCWDDFGSDPVEEVDVVFGAILSNADTSFDEICGLIV